jgi:hypothetical protein
MSRILALMHRAMSGAAGVAASPDSSGALWAPVLLQTIALLRGVLFGSPRTYRRTVVVLVLVFAVLLSARLPFGQLLGG